MTIVIVQLPISERSRRAAIKSAVQTARTYQELAAKGLIGKHYLNGPTGGGGVYLWRTREAADAWHDEAWKKRMTAQFGAEPSVTFYDCAVSVDNVADEIVVREET